MQPLASEYHSSGNAQVILYTIKLPPPSVEVLPGIAWGCASELFSPAFWKYQSYMTRDLCPDVAFQLGRTLLEEVAVCLLGGHGIPAELGLAAFRHIRDRCLLNPDVDQTTLEAALSEPLSFGRGTRRYRFPRQKAKFLWHAIQAIDALSGEQSPRQLRSHLTSIPGIGPKTASWIVRNHFGCNEVAILDIHILRAGAEMGLFTPNADPAREYYSLESRFLEFCYAIEEPASIVDALMWDYMRRIGPTSGVMAKPNQAELQLCQ
jgi:N-glycosylase/DNA lyase